MKWNIIINEMTNLNIIVNIHFLFVSLTHKHIEVTVVIISKNTGPKTSIAATEELHWELYCKVGYCKTGWKDDCNKLLISACDKVKI